MRSSFVESLRSKCTTRPLTSVYVLTLVSLFQSLIQMCLMRYGLFLHFLIYFGTSTCGFQIHISTRNRIRHALFKSHFHAHTLAGVSGASITNSEAVPSSPGHDDLASSGTSDVSSFTVANAVRQIVHDGSVNSTTIPALDVLSSLCKVTISLTNPLLLSVFACGVLQYRQCNA